VLENKGENTREIFGFVDASWMAFEERLRFKEIEKVSLTIGN
jgi:hypothetical protein